MKIAIALLGIVLGAGIMHAVDVKQIHTAQQNEAQAAGLESECKAVLATR